MEGQPGFKTSDMSVLHNDWSGQSPVLLPPLLISDPNYYSSFYFHMDPILESMSLTSFWYQAEEDEEYSPFTSFS